jgi:uncharacterized protein (DUF924 family)
VTPSALGLWLLADPLEHSQAMQDLVTSQDLVVVVDGDTFTVARTHNEIISRMEAGNFPLPPAALA